MAGFFKNIFNHIVHGESTVDLERKQPVAEEVLQHSLAHADTSVDDFGNAYADRLREVLMETRTVDLELLRDRKITICLDTRLSSQKQGFFDKEILGIFYNDGVKGGTIALWDNGKTSQNTGFFDRSAYAHGSDMLEKMAWLMRTGNIDNDQVRYYFASYTRSTGKTTKTYTEWRSGYNFDDGTIGKNPELLKPPLKKKPGFTP
ncbi:MAG: hypothetical protein ACAH80_11500 [Alphaproteobacteria bacterium]